MSRGYMPLLVSGEELNEHIRLLNKKEREVFDTVYLWAISYMKNLMSHTQKKTTVQPLYLSLTGDAGVGKLFLTKSL